MRGWKKLTANGANRRGYTVSNDQLRGRLRRIEGQVRGIERMFDEQRQCIGLLTQISSVQAALDKVALGLLDDHARHCLQRAASDGQPEQMTDDMPAAGITPGREATGLKRC